MPMPHASGRSSSPGAADKAPEGAALEFRQRLFSSNALQDNVDHQRHQQEFHQEKAQAGVLYPEQIVLRVMSRYFRCTRRCIRKRYSPISTSAPAQTAGISVGRSALGDAQPEQRTVVVHGVERLDVAHWRKS